MLMFQQTLLFFSLVTCLAAGPVDYFETALGRTVRIQHIRGHIPLLTRDAIPHVLFELTDSGELVSHFGRANIESIAPHKKIITSARPHPYSETDEVEQESLSNGPTVRSGNGFSFVYFSETGELIAAWGPHFSLHALNSERYPGIFINTLGYHQYRAYHARGNSEPFTSDIFASVRESNALSQRVPREVKDYVEEKNPLRKLDTSSSRMAVECSKREKARLEISFVYDTTFCARFGSNNRKAHEAITAMVKEVEVKFQDQICVKLGIRSFEANCDIEFGDDLKRPELLKTCNSQKSDCQASRILLEHVQNAWQKSISASSNRDAVFFFSGYEDDTPVSGATYKSAACNDDLSYAWVEQHHPVVLAHEIGHMIGASHDSTGIMQSTVKTTEPIDLSPLSVLEINNFVVKNSRSWCLRRDHHNARYLNQKYGWSEPKSVEAVISGGNIIADVTFGSISGEGVLDLILLHTRVVSNTIIPSIYIVKGVECQGRICKRENPTPKKILPMTFKPEVTGFGIAYANIRDAASSDIVLTHIEPSSGSYNAYYRIGYGIGPSGEVAGNWSTIRPIPGWSAPNVQCSGITVAGVSSPTSNDLIIVHVYKRRDKNILQYRVGFNMSGDGQIQSGWSEPVEVIGWYGTDTTGVSVGVHDVDKNGVPDLVIYHMDNSTSAQNGFYRIGRNMDREGKVQLGWSDFINVPKTFDPVAQLQGVMAVGSFGTGAPTMAVVQRENRIFRYDWMMYLSSSALTEEILQTSAKREERENLADGCYTCYGGSDALTCAKEMRHCPSEIDEVILEKDDRTVRTTAPGIVRMGSNFPAAPIVNSLFCTGFHFMYKNNKECDVFDEDLVLAKGVELAFAKALGEIVPLEEGAYESVSLFDKPPPSELFGLDRKPVAVRVQITPQLVRHAKIVRQAMRKVQREYDYSNNFFGKLSKKVKRHNGVYIVIFAFKEISERTKVEIG